MSVLASSVCREVVLYNGTNLYNDLKVKQLFGSFEWGGTGAMVHPTA